MAAVFWVTSIASLVGVVLNIHGRRSCFAIWLATNSIWVYADLTHELLPQACLQLVYVMLSIYGLVRWRARETPKGVPATGG